MKRYAVVNTLSCLLAFTFSSTSWAEEAPNMVMPELVEGSSEPDEADSSESTRRTIELRSLPPLNREDLGPRSSYRFSTGFAHVTMGTVSMGTALGILAWATTFDDDYGGNIAVMAVSGVVAATIALPLIIVGALRIARGRRNYYEQHAVMR